MPAMDLRVGTVVESFHHGRGTVVSVGVNGQVRIAFTGWKADKKAKNPLRKHAWSGAELSYYKDGRFFNDGAFKDEKPVLSIVSQPEKEKKG